jgi:hypothetical protein
MDPTLLGPKAAPVTASKDCALMVVLLLTVMGLAYAGEDGVGAVPSRVYRMTGWGPRRIGLVATKSSIAAEGPVKVAPTHVEVQVPLPAGRDDDEEEEEEEEDTVPVSILFFGFFRSSAAGPSSPLLARSPSPAHTMRGTTSHATDALNKVNGKVLHSTGSLFGHSYA